MVQTCFFLFDKKTTSEKMKLAILFMLLAQQHAFALDLNQATLEQNTGDEMHNPSYAFNSMEIKSISENTFDKVRETLVTLDLGDNKFTSLPEKVFHGLINLTELNLSGNKLVGIEPSLFRGLENLEVLRLKGCDLKSIQPNIFKGLKKLRRLDLGN